MGPRVLIPLEETEVVDISDKDAHYIPAKIGINRLPVSRFHLARRELNSTFPSKHLLSPAFLERGLTRARETPESERTREAFFSDC